MEGLMGITWNVHAYTYMKIYKLHKQKRKKQDIGYLTNWNCKLQRKTKRFVCKHKKQETYTMRYRNLINLMLNISCGSRNVSY